MLPTLTHLRSQLNGIIRSREEQGHETLGLKEALAEMKDDYSAFAAFAERLANLPMDPDWICVEPDGLEEIWEECDPDRPLGLMEELDEDTAAAHIAAAFEGTVCGCMLGKPLEVSPTLDEIRKAAEAVGAWPLKEYVTEDLVKGIGRRHECVGQAVRENLDHVLPDDDINYRIIGMLLLEEKGIAWSKGDLMKRWAYNLPPRFACGPERMALLMSTLHLMVNGMGKGWETSVDENPSIWSVQHESCGALIRVDSYGYGCPGRPALAAEMAWRDSSWTHRRTGIYASMWVAAAIACAPVVKDRMEISRIALQFVPRRSRFHEITSDCMRLVEEAADWMEAYQRIHERYNQYGHCRIYQEVGTLINTLRFARDVGDGICIQVMQGNDTDCFGATVGSILGAHLGPGHLEARWLKPFNNRIHTALASFHEQSLSNVTRRMASLPARVNRDLAEL